MAADELAELADRAMKAPSAAGAGDAEAYVEDSRGLELRLYENEVESLSESVARGVGVRAWLHGRAGYAYGTDLSPGGPRGDRRRPRSAPRASPTRTSTRSPPTPAARPSRSRASPTRRPTSGRPSARSSSRAQIERASREADERVAVIEETVYAEESERIAIASTRGAEGAYEATSAYAFLNAIAAPTARRSPVGARLRPRPLARRPRPRRDRPRVGRARRVPPRRREAEVAHLRRRPRPDRRRLLRGLHRRGPLRRRRPARPLAVRRPPRRGGRLGGAHDRRRRPRPRGLRLEPVRRRGHARAAAPR